MAAMADSSCFLSPTKPSQRERERHTLQFLVECFQLSGVQSDRLCASHPRGLQGAPMALYLADRCWELAYNHCLVVKSYCGLLHTLAFPTLSSIVTGMHTSHQQLLQAFLERMVNTLEGYLVKDTWRSQFCNNFARLWDTNRFTW